MYCMTAADYTDKQMAQPNQEAKLFVRQTNPSPEALFVQLKKGDYLKHWKVGGSIPISSPYVQVSLGKTTNPM